MLCPVIQSIAHEALDIYRYVLFGAIIASWVAPGSSHPIVVFLNKVTEPVLAPIRKLLPDLGGIDISPIILLFAIHLLQRFI